MVKSLLIFILTFSFGLHADIFDFGRDKNLQSKIPDLVEKLKSLEMNDGPSFEDEFNKAVKGIEYRIEEEKLFCSGESADGKGKTLPAAQKQPCMRELKKHYLEATNTIFDLKKKYLGFIHQRQIERLSEIQKKIKDDIEKRF